MSIAGWVDFNKSIDGYEDIIGAMAKEIDADCAVYIQKEGALMQKQTAKITQKNANGDIYTIVFNGKIKKDEELISKLKMLNYNFSEDSDAEIVLCSFIEWQEKCLDSINGSYCFAVWKQKEKTLFLARDRLGVVPLYYYKYEGGIIFGALQVILKNPLLPRKIDSSGIMQIFLLGPGKISGSAIIKGVEEIKPAHYIYLSKASFTNKQYWNLKAEKHTDSLEDTVLKTKQLIIKSFNADFDSNAAYMLSGGLDSSIICALARSKGVNPQTYSVDFESNEQNFSSSMYQPERDTDYINLMVSHLYANNNYILLNNTEIARTLEKAAIARGLPGMADIDCSLLMLCNNIAQKHTVCFSGECADEFFGGYPWYNNEQMLYIDTFPWTLSLNIRKKLLKKELINHNADEYIYSLYSKTLKQTDYLEQDSPKDRRIREMFMLNCSWFMQTLLDRSYKMGAKSGIQIRVPFCDYTIAQYAYNMPWDFKAYKGREKGILREAFKDILPQKVVFRKKSPFPKTYSPVFYNLVREKLNNILKEKDNLLTSLVNVKYLKKLIDKPDADIPNWYGQLMRLPQIIGYMIQTDTFFKHFNIDLEL